MRVKNIIDNTGTSHKISTYNKDTQRETRRTIYIVYGRCVNEVIFRLRRVAALITVSHSRSIVRLVCGGGVSDACATGGGDACRGAEGVSWNAVRSSLKCICKNVLPRKPTLPRRRRLQSTLSFATILYCDADDDGNTIRNSWPHNTIAKHNIIIILRFK